MSPVVEGRCVCGAIIREPVRLKIIRQGVACWNCGRVWGYDFQLNKIKLLSGPTLNNPPVSDAELAE